VPEQAAVLGQIMAIAAAGNHSLALRSDGAVSAGENSYNAQ